MSPTRLRYTGLRELRAELRSLPENLHGEAENHADARANRAALEIRQAYAIVSGELVQGVQVEKVQRTRFYAGRRVQSKSPLAFIYENGTVARQTKLGYNRGRMPPKHVFVRAMIAQRRSFYDDLRDMMRRYGLRVTG